MKSLGVTFAQQPTVVGVASVAVFDGTCGNYIQLIQETVGLSSRQRHALSVLAAVLLSGTPRR